MAVVSTWIACEVGLFTDIAGKLGIEKNGYVMFFDVLPFRFYCISIVIFVFAITFLGCNFGPMKLAEGRARSAPGPGCYDKLQAGLLRSAAAIFAHRPRAFVALVPIAGLLIAHITGLWIDGGAHLLAHRHFQHHPYPAYTRLCGRYRPCLGAYPAAD